MLRGWLIEKTEGGQAARLTDIDEAMLPDGDVRVRVEWSTVNYKDGLAFTGRSPVVRKFPMVPGIDLAGTVTESRHDGLKAGDEVILNGYGLGETHWGAPGDGDRHRRLYGDAVPEGAGASGRHAG